MELHHVNYNKSTLLTSKETMEKLHLKEDQDTTPDQFYQVLQEDLIHDQTLDTPKETTWHEHTPTTRKG